MQKRFLYPLIGLCALCLILAGALIWREIDARTPPALLTESTAAPTSLASPVPDPTSTPYSEQAATPTQQPDEPNPSPPMVSATPTVLPTIKPSESPSVSTSQPTATSTSSTQPIASEFFNITIKDKTYAIKKGVDETTLKKHIGWMETSAAPGTDGVCVLMGHRNTQFRVLKDVQKGDVVTLTAADGAKFSYIIQSAKIVYDTETLQFPAQDGKVLTLVTCYPFHFVGHAPHKYVVTAVILE